MKKFTVLTVIAVMFACTSCGNKLSEESSADNTSITSLTKTETISETTQSASVVSSSETTSALTSTSLTSAYTTSDLYGQGVTETTSISTETSSDTTIPQDFEQIDGGIIFNDNISEQDDETLISAAFVLYKSACETEWAYTVGSPYELDTSQVIENMYGWESYLIVTEGIYTLDDVKADYHKVFSENYPDNLDEVFTESDGRVYCLNGARGADIFYTGSSIVSVNSRTDSEISFTAESYYSGDDFGNEAYTVEDEFVISIDSDGAWRVAKFRMPY